MFQLGEAQDWSGPCQPSGTISAAITITPVATTCGNNDGIINFRAIISHPPSTGRAQV